MNMISASNIRRLMRVHHMTIRALAARMNITMKRVREVRARGVTGDCMCQDWLEGITATGLFAPHVTLPDGFGGSTRTFFSVPLEKDGDLVKLRCADPGCEYLIKWARASELSAAIQAQH